MVFESLRADRIAPFEEYFKYIVAFITEHACYNPDWNSGVPFDGLMFQIPIFQSTNFQTT
jgi:hypothetical protein